MQSGLFFLFAIFMWTTSVARAGVEASAGIDGSTYPLLAGEATAEFGYELPFWNYQGELQKADGYRYGYLHPYFSGASAGAYQLVTGALEFYPISFLSLQTGTSWQRNSTKYDGFNCVDFQCEGDLSEFFIEGAFEFQLGRFSGDIRFHQDQWQTSSAPSALTIEPTSGLLLTHHEKQNKITTDLLWQWQSQWQSFVSANYIESLNARGFSRAIGAGGIYKFGRYAVTFGAGAFKSQIKPLNPVFFMQLTWFIKPGFSHKDLLSETQDESKLR